MQRHGDEHEASKRSRGASERHEERLPLLHEELVSHKQSPNIKTIKWISATWRRGEDVARGKATGKAVRKAGL